MARPLVVERPLGRQAWPGPPVALAAIAILLLAAGWLANDLRRPRRAPQPTYQRLTFRRGHVDCARFAPDGKTVLYSATFGGGASRIYETRPESPESVALELPDARLLAVSPTGELAIATSVKLQDNLYWFTGTLARVALTGGAPRQVVEDVWAADWNPKDGELAVIRNLGGHFRLEYPIGRLLCDARGILGYARFSRDGSQMAFFEGDFGGTTFSVNVIDTSGKKKTLSSGWTNLGTWPGRRRATRCGSPPGGAAEQPPGSTPSTLRAG